MNKNTVMIIVVVLCLLAAGIVVAMQLSKGGSKNSEGPTNIGPATSEPAPAN